MQLYHDDNYTKDAQKTFRKRRKKPSDSLLIRKSIKIIWEPRKNRLRPAAQKLGREMEADRLRGGLGRGMEW